jgi:hypothetical protein
MKTLVKLSAISCLVCILFTCTKDPSFIPIKDKIFLNVLIENGVDRNGDGHISAEEAEMIKSPLAGLFS